MKKTLLFLRHGSTGVRKGEGYMGRTDIPLDEHGRQQSARALPLIQSYQPERFFCSPLRRCVETARLALGEEWMSRVELEPDLQEVNFGRWEGKSFAEIEKNDPADVAKWAELKNDFTFPEGESYADFQARVLRAMGRIEKCPEETILVVTHGGIIRTLICHYLGLSPDRYLLFDVQHAGLVSLDLFDSGGVLTGLNLLSPAQSQQWTPQ